MRIALGGISHEANSFSPRPTDRSDFERGWLKRGAEITEGLEGVNIEESGAASVLSGQEGCEIIPLLSAKALSGGPILSEVFRSLRDELLERLANALPVDGVLLVLHGAMMAEDEPDATGEVLRAVRAMVGPQVPVVGTLDLHANVTQRMADSASALVGYHTTPHVDLYDTGQAAARLLVASVRGEVSLRMALVRIPLLVASERARSTDGPLSEVIGAAVALESTDAILHAGIFPVQRWLDIEDTAASVVVVSDGDLGAAQEQAQVLAQAFWKRRSAFVPELVRPDEAIRRAYAREDGMVIFCDSADSPTSGATGDSTLILGAMLRACPLPQTALLNVVDPQAVAQAIDAGVGSRVTVQVGGRLAPSFHTPVAFEGHVKTISEGTFRFKGPGMRGVTYRMGRTVVLIQGGIHLVVMERAVSQWDPQLYRSVGEEPADARIVQVKSPAAFRAAYEGIADEIIVIESRGISSPSLSSMPWQHLRRPIYPLQADTTFP